MESNYPLLEAIWTIALVALWALWLFIIIWTLIDNFRRSDHSGWAKAGWTFLIIALPLLGVLVYLVVRPTDVEPMGFGSNDYAYRDPPVDTTTQLTQLAELREKGVLNEHEFEAQKQKLLNA
jgi:thiol:disulfide interchange protein